jgi:site-specific DNA-methyltransferase (adenine-specific)
LHGTITGLNTAKLALGDCLALFSKIPDNSIPLIVADLPFGVTRCAWDKKLKIDHFWKEVERVLTATGTVLMHATQPFTSELVQSNRPWFKYEIIWKKSRPTGFQHSATRMLSNHENILVFSPGVIVGKYRSQRQMTYNAQGLVALEKPVVRTKEKRINMFGGSMFKGAVQRFTNFPRTVLSFDSVPQQGRFHATQKPVDLLTYLILTFSNAGDVVLDPTMGSGSTGVAAIETGRNFAGFELDQHYFDVSVERIRKAGGAVQVI